MIISPPNIEVFWKLPQDIHPKQFIITHFKQGDFNIENYNSKITYGCNITKTQYNQLKQMQDEVFAKNKYKPEYRFESCIFHGGVYYFQESV